MRNALQKLPTGSEAYDHAYSTIMERILGQVKKHECLALNVLSWITCAKRPLTISEIQHALAVEPGKNRFDKGKVPPLEIMVSVCAGLVTIDEESSIVRLVHYTTQQFFEQNQNKWFTDAEARITTICVTYLSLGVFKSGYCTSDEDYEDRLRSYPFYEYATQNWGHHARHASHISSNVMEFLDMSAQIAAASQALYAKKRPSLHSGYSQDFPKPTSGFHLAAYFGIESIVRYFLGRNSDVDITDGWDQTPLWLATANGHEAVVKLLLAAPRINVNAIDRFGQTPLGRAAENGHEAVVRLLLAAPRIDVNATDRWDPTPLGRAAANGHEGVVKLLLTAPDIDVNGRNRRDSESAATKRGLVGKGLPARYFDHDATDMEDSQIPLLIAAKRGYVGVVELLLATHDINVTIKDKHGRSSLVIAVQNGHVAVVKRLLAAYGVEFHGEDHV